MIAPAIDLLGLDSLSGTKMTFLTPKRMGIPPLVFILKRLECNFSWLQINLSKVFNAKAFDVLVTYGYVVVIRWTYPKHLQ